MHIASVMVVRAARPVHVGRRRLELPSEHHRVDALYPLVVVPDDLPRRKAPLAVPVGRLLVAGLRTALSLSRCQQILTRPPQAVMVAPCQRQILPRTRFTLSADMDLDQVCWRLRQVRDVIETAAATADKGGEPGCLLWRQCTRCYPPQTVHDRGGHTVSHRFPSRPLGAQIFTCQVNGRVADRGPRLKESCRLFDRHLYVEVGLLDGWILGRRLEHLL